ncbi:MAG: SAM-dependent methyltransferase [Bacteroidetes bacterium]|nr:SAM-dependent methyltransferase [Bacteroidota bacterium]MBI3481981.1 SAM-dependent methyltransferase [Bacteroidota bacterium]
MSPIKIEPQNHPASFRDPSGYIFESEGVLYRNINAICADDYNFLLSSGLAQTLFANYSLVPHDEVEFIQQNNSNSYKVIQPQRLPLISYPYEWCFGQLKDAALLTLNVLKVALDHGMILKDASAFNVQFRNGGNPIFIDTLSFTIYKEGQTWAGYKQFCEHFLAPLSLGSFLGVEYLSLWKSSLDGVSLPMASQLLPWYTNLLPSTFMHIHLHSKTVEFYSSKRKPQTEKEGKISKRNLVAMVDQLSSFVTGLNINKKTKTQWQDYDKETHYSEKSRNNKATLVKELVAQVAPRAVWDIGANDGFFSRLIADERRHVLSLDIDPLAVEKNYGYVKEINSNVYPLIFALTNPTPSIGWANKEREKLTNRSKPDLIMALALIHHIVITHNVPFIEVAKYFSSIAEWLIIEFVPADDDKILSLPNTAGKRTYNRENFDRGLLHYYKLIADHKIEGSDRRLLLLRKTV